MVRVSHKWVRLDDPQFLLSILVEEAFRVSTQNLKEEAKKDGEWEKRWSSCSSFLLQGHAEAPEAYCWLPVGAVALGGSQSVGRLACALSSRLSMVPQRGNWHLTWRGSWILQTPPCVGNNYHLSGASGDPRPPGRDLDP